MNRIKLIYSAFPAPADVVGGLTIRDPSGGLTILINTVKPEEEQRKYLKHEFSHIILGHLWDDRIKGDDLSYLDDNPEVEDEANRYADQMTDETLSEYMTGLIGETVYL